MGKGDLFGRILRGRTEPKKQEEKSETPIPPPVANPVEQVLNVKLSRRNVLGGAATSAARAAHMATMPQAPVVITREVVRSEIIKEGVSEKSALLAPFAKLNIMMSQAGARTDDDSDGFVHRLEQILTEKSLDFFSNPQAELNPAKIVETSAMLEGFTNQLGFLNPSLTIGNLLDTETVSKAFTLAGSNEANPGKPEELYQLGKVYKIATNLGDASTLKEVAKTLYERQTILAERALAQLDSFPRAQDKWNVLKQLQTALYPYEDDVVQRPSTEKSRQVLGKIKDALEKNYDPYQAEVKQEKEKSEDAMAQHMNSSLESRGEIYCDVSFVSSAGKKGQSFRIKPASVIRGVTQGLSRMHLEHYRQLLYAKAKRLDEYIAAEPIIEESIGEPEDGIVVSTSDGLLIEHLENAAKNNTKIQIPNRLQAISLKNEE